MKSQTVNISQKDINKYIQYRSRFFFLKAENRNEIKTLDTKKLKEGFKKIFQIKLGKKILRIEKLSRSTLNQVFKVTARGNNRYIIRINTSTDKDIKQLQFLLEYYLTRKLKEANISCPEVYMVNLSRKVIPFDYQISQGVRGKSIYDLSKTKKKLDKEIYAFGKSLADIHLIRTNNYGPFNPEYITEDKLSGIHDMWGTFLNLNVNEHIESCIKYNLISNKESKTISNILSKLRNMELTQPVLLHGDVANHNAYCQQGDVVLIDWEDCLSGDPVYDLAYYATGCFGHNQWYKKFIDGYTKINNLPDDFDLRYSLYYLRISLSKVLSRINSGTLNSKNLPSVRNRIIFAIKQADSIKRS